MKSTWWCCMFATLAIGGCAENATSSAGAISCAGTEGCNAACSDDDDCEVGFYCTEENQCGRDCSDDNLRTCAAGQVCNAYGRCGSPTDPVRISSGGRTETSSDTAGTTSKPIAINGDCVRTEVQANKAIPKVMLIVDQSGSMRDRFGERSRWEVLYESLMAEPDGLVPSLQSQVRFGLALYSAENERQCPVVAQVDPELDNFQAIAATYDDAEPMQDTPTGDAIDAIIESLDVQVPTPDSPPADPLVFVLATDGEPDRCEELNPQNGQEEALAAVRRAYSLGVRTFVISVGDELTETHHRAMANAGLGRTEQDPQADFWVAGDDESLRAALTDIIAGKLTCEITLNGRVEGDNACSGAVELNGTKLSCNDANGWELVDPTHVRLNGRACEELKAPGGAKIDISFPCEVEVLF